MDIQFRGEGLPYGWHFEVGGIYVHCFALAVLAGFLIPLVRKTLTALVFKPVGQYMLSDILKKKCDNNGKVNINQPPNILLLKWVEACWETFGYGFFTLCAIYASYQEKWFTSTPHFWLGCTNMPCDSEISPRVLFLYICEMGWYLQAIPYVIFFALRKKDHYQMIAHHVVTLGLIVYSYIMNFNKVGCMIMLLHDVCDVFLQMAKLANYTEKEAWATGLFLCFMVVWFSMRIVYYPLWIIRSTFFETVEIIGIPYGVDPQPHWAIFNGMLGFLYLIHIYWSYLILRIAYKAIAGGDLNDNREDEE